MALVRPPFALHSPYLSPPPPHHTILSPHFGYQPLHLYQHSPPCDFTNPLRWDSRLPPPDKRVEELSDDDDNDSEESEDEEDYDNDEEGGEVIVNDYDDLVDDEECDEEKDQADDEYATRGSHDDHDGATSHPSPPPSRSSAGFRRAYPGDTANTVREGDTALSQYTPSPPPPAPHIPSSNLSTPKTPNNEPSNPPASASGASKETPPPPYIPPPPLLPAPSLTTADAITATSPFPSPSVLSSTRRIARGLAQLSRFALSTTADLAFATLDSFSTATSSFGTYIDEHGADIRQSLTAGFREGLGASARGLERLGKSALGLSTAIGRTGAAAFKALAGTEEHQDQWEMRSHPPLENAYTDMLPPWRFPAQEGESMGAFSNENGEHSGQRSRRFRIARSWSSRRGPRSKSRSKSEITSDGSSSRGRSWRRRRRRSKSSDTPAYNNGVASDTGIASYPSLST